RGDDEELGERERDALAELSGRGQRVLEERDRDRVGGEVVAEAVRRRAGGRAHRRDRLGDDREGPERRRRQRELCVDIRFDPLALSLRGERLGWAEARLLEKS